MKSISEIMKWNDEIKLFDYVYDIDIFNNIVDRS